MTSDLSFESTRSGSPAHAKSEPEKVCSTCLGHVWSEKNDPMVDLVEKINQAASLPQDLTDGQQDTPFEFATFHQELQMDHYEESDHLLEPTEMTAHGVEDKQKSSLGGTEVPEMSDSERSAPGSEAASFKEEQVLRSSEEEFLSLATPAMHEEESASSETLGINKNQLREMLVKSVFKEAISKEALDKIYQQMEEMANQMRSSVHNSDSVKPVRYSSADHRYEADRVPFDYWMMPNRDHTGIRMRIPVAFLGKGTYKEAFSLVNIYIPLNGDIAVRMKWKALLKDLGYVDRMQIGTEAQEEIRRLIGSDARIVSPIRWLPNFRSINDLDDRLEGYTRWYNGDFSQAASAIGIQSSLDDSFKTKISFQDSLQVLSDVADTMARMADKGAVHADLKSLNVFISNSEADGKIHGYVADFDFATLMSGEAHDRPCVVNGSIFDYFARDYLGKRGVFTPDCDVAGYANLLATALGVGSYDKIPRMVANPKAYWLNLSASYVYELPKNLPPALLKQCKDYLEMKGCDDGFFQMCLKAYPTLDFDQKEAFLSFIRKKQACYTLWNTMQSIYQTDEKRVHYVQENAQSLQLADAISIPQFDKLYRKKENGLGFLFTEWLGQRTDSLLRVAKAVPLPTMKEVQAKVQRAMEYLSTPYSPTEVTT